MNKISLPTSGAGRPTPASNKILFATQALLDEARGALRDDEDL